MVNETREFSRVPFSMTSHPPRTRIQRRNRRAILDAALAVFSQHGFRGATLDRIAAEAGLSKPNLLCYFPSRRRSTRRFWPDFWKPGSTRFARSTPRANP